MRYFRMIQSRDTTNVVSIPAIKSDELHTGHGLVSQIELDENSVFLNFYESPLPIISNKLKDAIMPLQSDVIGQPLALANMDTAFETLYWVLNLKEIACQMENSAIILNRRSIGRQKLFKVMSGMRYYVIADLDILECALRASVSDMDFEEVIIHE